MRTLFRVFFVGMVAACATPEAKHESKLAPRVGLALAVAKPIDPRTPAVEPAAATPPELLRRLHLSR